MDRPRPDRLERRPRRLTLLTALVAAAAAGGTLAGCSTGPEASSGDSAASSSEAGVSAGSDVEPRSAAERATASDALGKDAARSILTEAGPGPAEQAPGAPSPMVISIGTVSLRADDVADARFEVQQVVDRFAGTVTDEETRTDDDGEVRTSRMVLRVPSRVFPEAMTGLEAIGRLEASTTDSEDVTTQVIDTRVRIRAQRASILRIETLLARARNIRDVVAVEAQLTRRQAALNSLLRQRAYLADQTSLSTITVHLQRTPREAERDDRDDASGFLGGLAAGLHGLAVVAVALATVAGALLPWLAVLLVLGALAWPLLRSLRRRRPPPAAQAQAD